MSTIDLNKNKTLFNDNLSTKLKVISGTNSELGKLVATGGTLADASLPLELLDGQLEAEPKDDKYEIQLADNADMTINGKASANLRIGIYTSESEVEDALEANEDGLDVKLQPLGTDQVYVVFVMGYSLSAKLNGKWAFGKGNVKVGLDGGKERRQAVIRRFNKDTKVPDAILTTIQSVRSVKSITAPQVADGNSGPGLLPLNTTLILNTGGSISGGLDVTAGYDFNWAYTSEIKNLEGNLGLKAKLGATLGLTFGVSGSLALAMSNLGEERIRLQSFKQNANSWGFAASLEASIQGELDDKLKDKTTDDLLKAVLGTHYEQVMTDLKKIEKATSPENIKDKVRGFTKALWSEISGSQIAEDFEEKRNELLDVIDKWEGLGAEAGAELWDLLDKLSDGDLAKLRGEVAKYAALKKEDFRDLLEEKIEDIGFLDTPVGKLLDELIPKDALVDALIDSSLLETLMKKVDGLHDLLDVQGWVERIHETISQHLDIAKIEDAVKNSSLDNIETWLLARVEEGLETKPVATALKTLGEVNEFIKSFRKQAGTILEATKKALEDEYKFSIAYQYQKSNEHSALVDATFDFSTNIGTVERVFTKTIDGDINDLLKKKINGIKLNQGVLTAKTKRRSSVSITLPFMKRDFVHLNEAIANNKVVSQADGMLHMFDLEGEDSRSSTFRLSAVTVNLLYHKLLAESGDKVKKESLDVKYSFKLARPKFKKENLQQLLKPYINLYLKQEFEKETGVADVQKWIDNLEDAIERQSAMDKKRFGNTLVKMSVGMPGDVGNAWFSAPADIHSDVYRDVARAVQVRLKELVPMYFLADDKKFNKPYVVDNLHAILIYKNLPYIPLVKEVKNGKFQYVNDLTTNIIPPILDGAGFRFKMEQDVRAIKRALLADDDKKTRKLANRIKVDALPDVYYLFQNRNRKPVEAHVSELFNIQMEMTDRLITTALTMARFREESGSDSTMTVQDVVNTLRRFGKDLAQSINGSEWDLISNKGDYTRYLGMDIFYQVAKVFDKNLERNTQGLLQLQVLKDDSGFDYRKYLTGTDPDSKDVILQQVITDED